MGQVSACLRLETDLTLDEAYAILSPFFEEARQVFLEARRDAGDFTRLSEAAFHVAHNIHDTPRHFAACSETGKKIVAAPELAELGYPLVIGILAHECGHAADFLYPGEFALGPGGSVMRRNPEHVSETQWIRWQKTWSARDEYVVELTADGIAETVWGSPIGYTGPCKLQNFRTGEARPQGLR